MYNQFVGTGVALVTPFDEKGKVDFEGLKRLVHHTLSNGIDYLVVNGTTAESATTTEEEKLQILTCIKEVAEGKAPIVYGIGGNNTQAVIEKIKTTDFTGISAILSVSPYYNKPSQEGIYLHYKAIAEISPVPVILYNVPGRTGSNVSASTTIRLSKLPNIVGIKDANTDVMQNLEVLKNVNENFLLLSGDDMWALPLISMGGKGVISVLANAYPKEFSELVRLSLDNKFEKGATLLKKFVELNPLLYEEGNPVGIKLVLQELGICGAHTRLPLAPPSDNLKEKIKKSVKNI